MIWFSPLKKKTLHLPITKAKLVIYMQIFRRSWITYLPTAGPGPNTNNFWCKLLILNISITDLPRRTKAICTNHCVAPDLRRFPFCLMQPLLLFFFFFSFFWKFWFRSNNRHVKYSILIGINTWDWAKFESSSWSTQTSIIMILVECRLKFYCLLLHFKIFFSIALIMHQQKTLRILCPYVFVFVITIYK